MTTARVVTDALAWARQDLVTSRTTRRVIGVAAFAIATALSARVALPVPGTPVPFTLQPLCVLLAGAILGPGLGAASQFAYVAAGAAGAPIFVAGGGLVYLLGPTGGYLLAYPLAAYAVGRVAGDGGGTMRLVAGLLAGLAVIYLGGASWLAVITGSPARALAVGIVPFVIADLIKVFLGFLIALRVRPRALELF